MASLKVWHWFENPNGDLSYNPSGSSTLGYNYTYWLDVSLESWGPPSALSLTNMPVVAEAQFSMNGKTLDDNTKLYSTNYYTFRCHNMYNTNGDVFMPVHNEDQTKLYLLYGAGFADTPEPRTLRVGIVAYLWSTSENSFKNIPQPSFALRGINIYY